MPDADVPVVIVGGSLVGLSAAVFLGAQGVPSLVVERHPGTAIHPRAALVSQRTVELFRALGLQPEIESAAAAEFVHEGKAHASVWFEGSSGKGNYFALDGARYVELPGCGHCPPLEQPEAFLDAIRDFVRL